MRNIIFNFLNVLFSYVATSGLVIAEFVKTNEVKYKISIVGIIFLIVILLVAKTAFVRGYQNKTNDLLQELANEATVESKDKVNAKIRRHKVIMAVIDNFDATMPLFVLMVATSFIGDYLKHMSGLIGLIWLSMTIGSGFNIWKKAGGRK
jgi:amino acid permease